MKGTIESIFWICILVYLIAYVKKNNIRFCKNRKYLLYMIIITFVYINIYFYMGFILGFSKSPYNHKLSTILENIVTQIPQIISIEIVRNVIATRNKNNKKVLLFLTIALILIEINYNILINIYPNKEELFKYICGNIVPLIASNILYNYLTLKGSYSLTLVFRLLNEIAVILFPVFPTVNWFVTGSIGVITPIIIYVLFKYRLVKEPKSIRKKENRIRAKISYIITIILSISLVCFMLGIFKYEPIAILSNSMVPTFSRGDVVVFEKIPENQLEQIPKNSIIVYSIDDQNIVHRVVNIIDENDTILYQTKGDSNNIPDTNLVKINQIKGIYAFHIKYIGFPSIWLYDYFNEENAQLNAKVKGDK